MSERDDEIQVLQFDSLEDMQAHLRRTEAEANERVVDAQRNVSWGDHWLRGPVHGFLIFGRVHTLPEHVASEVMHVFSFRDEGEFTEATRRAEESLERLRITGEALAQGQVSPSRWRELVRSLRPNDSKSQHAEVAEESLWTLRSTVESHGRGYRFGTAYSVVTPEGELGSTHVHDLWPISAGEFAEAREDDWSLEKVRDRPWLQRVAREMAAHRPRG